MSEKYIFTVIKYPKADTAIEALAALMGLMQNNIASFKDAVAVTKTEIGDLELHLVQSDVAGEGFLNSRLIGIIFADLFGVTGWDISDAYAGTAFAILGQGIEDKLLDEFGEKMTSAESAVVLLVEHAHWRIAADNMRPHNFQGAIVMSQNVIGDLADVEKQLEDEKMIVLIPAKEEESIAPAPEKEVEVTASLPEKLVIPIPKGLKYIEGIGDIYRQKLREVGIRNVDELLEKGSTVKGRNEIVNQTGISEKLLLKWVNMADLYRIRGIGQEYARLLEIAGVDTVPELAQRVPAHLHEAMAAANAEKKLVSHLPASSQVESWVAQAKSLPRTIHY